MHSNINLLRKLSGYKDVLTFWFEELTPSQWWAKDKELDKAITSRFEITHRLAISGELYAWRNSPEGSLAEIITLDQFSRNMYRGEKSAFDADGMALLLAQVAVEKGADKLLPDEQRSFLYMPYMHSESPFIHEQAIKLFSQEGLEGNLSFELQHKAIIDQFGRYPHRNEILNRKSTAEELEFLKRPNSSF